MAMRQQQTVKTVKRVSELDALADLLDRSAFTLDGAHLLHQLGLQADPWQVELLRTEARRVLLCCSRQAGKSTATSVLALDEALYKPPALILLLSPSQRQSMELFRKVLGFYRQLGRPEPAIEENKLSLELTNGSRILSLPSVSGIKTCT
jgi:hypothetical protein